MGEKGVSSAPAAGWRLASGRRLSYPMRALGPLCFLLLLLPGAPALSGCDSQQAGQCVSADAFAIEDITPEGTTLGATAESGSCVSVRYVGRLAGSGEVFDEGEINEFFLDRRSGLITGFIIGVTNQRERQTRRVTVPPGFGYGANSRDAREGTVGGVEGGTPYVGIPSCSTLEFDITLTRVFSDTRTCAL